MSEAVVQAILERRARDLARAPRQEREPDLVDILVMALEGGAYAVAAAHVRAVVRNEGVVRLPVGSGAFLGVIATHGDAVPVADLGQLLGLGTPGLARSFVVVLDGAAPAVGLLVDRANALVRVSGDRVRRGERRPDASPLAHVAIAPDGVLLLNADAILQDPRLAVAPRTSLASTRVKS